MNMAEDASSWQSAARAAEECQYLNQLYDKEDLKVIFLTEWGKKMDGNLCHRGGGVQRLMANAILNFQFFGIFPYAAISQTMF